jgi:hypothetical protein
MEQLKLLGVALGLASLAGINLYLTVFATGLAIHYHWIVLDPAYQSLAILGHPAVIIVAGTLYFLEFFADKIPWVDTAWDAVHTIIRPIGGALLAVQVLGHPSPLFSVLVALVAGGASLITHTAKATTRLVSNASPEPVSNIALSLGEDVAVIGGLFLIHHNPLIALAVICAGVAVFFYFAASILRAMKTRIWLTLAKLNGPADTGKTPVLPSKVPSQFAAAFDKENTLKETVAWAVPCISGPGKGIPKNVFGALVATREQPRNIFFVARKSGRPFAQLLEIDRCVIERDPRFLADNILIASEAGKRPRYSFVFSRPEKYIVDQVVEDLRMRISAPIWPIGKTAVEPEPVKEVTGELVEAASETGE